MSRFLHRMFMFVTCVHVVGSFSPPHALIRDTRSLTFGRDNTDMTLKAFLKNPVCPAYCKCNLLRKSVTCSGEDLQWIPKIPPSTTKLRIDRATITILSRESLSNVSLSGAILSTLKITNSGIRNLTSNAFLDQTAVNVLDLSGNLFQVKELQVSICAFANKNLQVLTLDKLGFVYLPNSMFACLGEIKLTSLSLNTNGFPTFTGALVKPFPLLSKISLKGNKIKTITRIDYLKNVKYLNLENNLLQNVPVFCNSHRQSFVPVLNKLILSWNKIFQVSQRTFCGLEELRYLHLDHNDMPELSNNFLALMPKVTYVYLNHNPFSKITDKALASATMIRLDLGYSKFKFTNSNAAIFSRCPALTSLYLTNCSMDVNNRMIKVMFSPLKSLQKLQLQGAGLRTIPQTLFGSLPSLRILRLSQNSIRSWSTNTFTEAKNVVELYLDSNNINMINETSFHPTLLKTLKKLYLAQNPFNCTCDLRWFRNWLNNTDIEILRWDVRKLYTCNSPIQWKGKPLYSYKPTKEDCTPLHMNTVLVVGVSLAALVALITVIMGLLYRYRFYIRYICAVVKARRNHYRALEGNDQDYVYDGFVAYSSRDHAWVVEHLLREVEYNAGCKLCYDKRNFTAGRGVAENIIEAIDQSRKVLLIVSQRFATSGWCRWEMTMAQHRLLDDTRHDALIIILLEPIEINGLNKTLAALLQKRTYIEWPDTSHEKKLFWKQVIAALRRPNLEAVNT